jgi:hypothetical protein
VTGAEAERVANLRGGFALPCQRTETCNLLGGMHGGALLVLGDGGKGGNVVGNTLHHNGMVSSETPFLRQQLQGS